MQQREKKMKKYLSEAEALVSGIVELKFLAIPREENQEVNALSKYALAPISIGVALRIKIPLLLNRK